MLEESSIERLSTSGQTAWRMELPKEAQRQMVVLGQTVLLWGGDDELRRLDINTGRPSSPNSPSRTVLAYLTHEQVLVQATATGLIGLGPHKTVWRRDELLVGSLALAGSKDAPVVLAVERKSGQALAIDLNSGANLDFPVPRGKFDKVLLEADSGVIGWVPHEGATVYTNPETGEPV